MAKSRSLILAALLAAGVLTGCTTNKPEQNSTSNTTEQTTSRLILGTKSTASQKVVLTNKTGYPIIKVVLKPAGSTQAETNLLAEGKTWDQNKQADLYIAPEDQKVDNLNLTITIKNGDEEKTYQFDGFPVDTIGDAADLELDGEALVIKTKDDKTNASHASESQADANPSIASEEPVIDDTEVIDSQQPSMEDSSSTVDPSLQPSVQEPVYIEPVYIGPDGTEEDPSDPTGVDQVDPAVDAGTGEQASTQDMPAL